MQIGLCNLLKRPLAELTLLDTALLQWKSEYVVRAYTTADSAVSYLTTLGSHRLYTVVCFVTHD